VRRHVVCYSLQLGEHIIRGNVSCCDKGILFSIRTYMKNKLPGDDNALYTTSNRLLKYILQITQLIGFWWFFFIGSTKMMFFFISFLPLYYLRPLSTFKPTIPIQFEQFCHQPLFFSFFPRRGFHPPSLLHSSFSPSSFPNLVGRYNVRRWERRTRQNSSKKQPWLQRQRETELWDSFSSALSRRHLALLAAPYPTHDAVTFKGPAVRFQWSARPGLCSRLLQRTTTAAAAATFSSPAQNGEAHWQSFKEKNTVGQ
jgi:hypothetical protein